jgi:general secretion pathway protein J
MTPAPNAQSGFTLVEAMVSLFVFALLATGCVAMLMQSVDTQKRIGTAEDSLRELQTARALLASDVAQLVPQGVPGQGGGATGFEGLGTGVETDRHMTLVRGVGEADPAATLATSQIAVEYRIDDQGRLVRRTSTAMLPGPQARAQVRERLLLEGAQDVRFQFYDGLNWRDDWLSASGAAPRAVAILATLPRYGDVRVSAFVGLR